MRAVRNRRFADPPLLRELELGVEIDEIGGHGSQIRDINVSTVDEG
jgi:hypothetical protein